MPSTFLLHPARTAAMVAGRSSLLRARLATTLIRADQALYRAKNNGRNCVEITEFKIAV